MKTELTNGFTVDTWYHKDSKSWITQILDAAGNQVGDAVFAGNRTSARFDHQLAISDAQELEAQ